MNSSHTHQRSPMNSQHTVLSISRDHNICHLVCANNDGGASAIVAIPLPGNDVTVDSHGQAGLQVLIEVRSFVIESDEPWKEI